MPHIMIIPYFRLPYFHVSNSALFFVGRATVLSSMSYIFSVRTVWSTFHDSPWYYEALLYNACSYPDRAFVKLVQFISMV